MLNTGLEKKKNRNAAGIKRMILLFSSFVALFLLLSVRSKADSNYTPVQAVIPFYCENTESLMKISYIITLNGISENAPLPNTSQMTLAGGESGNFLVNVSEPGTYIYRLSQQKGNVKYALYDDKEYDVYLYVTNYKEKELIYSLSVVQANGDVKPDEVVFINKMSKASEDTQERDSSKRDEPSKSDSGGNSTENPTENNLTPGSLIAGKTGENNYVYIGLYIGSIFALLVGAIIYVVVKKHRKADASNIETE